MYPGRSSRGPRPPERRAGHGNPGRPRRRHVLSADLSRARLPPVPREAAAHERRRRHGRGGHAVHEGARRAGALPPAGCRTWMRARITCSGSTRMSFAPLTCAYVGAIHRCGRSARNQGPARRCSDALRDHGRRADRRRRRGRAQHRAPVATPRRSDPRTSRPGRAPVGSSSSSVTSPATSVAR